MKQEKREDTHATGGPIMAEKKKRPAIDKKAAFPVSTNVYPVQTKHIPVFRYDVTMNVHYPRADGTFAERCITKKDQERGGDATLQERHSMCRDVFRKLRAEDDMVKKQRHVYYDLQSILFSLDPLGIGKGTAYTVILKVDTLNKNLFGRAKNVEVIIKEVREGDIQLMLDDHSGANRDLSLEDRALLQFLDIATSQHAYFNEKIHVPFNANRTYLVDPTKHGFRPQDLAEFPDNGAYLGIGCQKAANWVEGPNKGKCLSVVLDTKKTAFHGCEQVLEKFKRLVRNYRDLRNGDFDKVRRILSGVEVMTTHRQNNRLYKIRTVVNIGANQKKIETEEYGEITIEQYFQKKYGIKLREPTIPMLETLRGELFPMEVCAVADSQRVRTEQQTSQQVQEMIRKCAVPPIKHREQIDQMFNAMSLEKSDCLRDAQIKVHTQPVTVQDARILPLPQLVYKQDQPARVDQTGQWKMQGRFVKPSGCKKWMAYAFLGPRDRLLINEFMQFLVKFSQEALKYGLQLPNQTYKHPEIKAASDNFKVLEDMVKEAKRDGCDFFVMVHGDSDDTTHAYIKLLEQRYEIVTQEFRVSTVNKVVQRNQWQTMQNVVFKTNCKMGGLNYTLFSNNQTAKQIMGTDTLFIGVAINYPSGAKGPVSANQSESVQNREEPPTVVGYAANVGRCDEFEFVGDFVFQECRGQVFVKSMGKIVEQVLALHKRVRKGPPKRIVIYRNECSDGRLPTVLTEEVPHIKTIFTKAGCKSAKLTYVAVSKMQGVRLFKQQIDPDARPPEQNIPVGLVVDSTIVHPEYTEFFLNSHRALQGTARTPRYVVAVDESNFPLAQLEEITYQLCYGHQIVNMPTSTPSPVYIANRYAERGRKVFNSRMKEDRNAVFSVDCDTLTRQLAYHGKEELKQRRINA